MHKVARLFVIQWSTLLQYRFDVFLWMLVEAMTPLISLAVWYRVAQSGALAFNPKETFTYYILLMFVFTATNSWNGFFFSREILNGEIARYLVRPISIFWRHIAENLMEKTIKLTIPLLLLLGFIALFPHYFIPSIYVPSTIALFVVSLVLALALSFAFDMCLGAIAFWLEDVEQLRSYKVILQEVTSGVIIPYAFLPPAVFAVFSWLPFRYIVSVPLEIIMGRSAGSDAVRLMGIQAVWVVGLAMLLAILWRKGLQRYAVPGQ